MWGLVINKFINWILKKFKFFGNACQIMNFISPTFYNQNFLTWNTVILMEMSFMFHTSIQMRGVNKKKHFQMLWNISTSIICRMLSLKKKITL